MTVGCRARGLKPSKRTAKTRHGSRRELQSRQWHDVAQTSVGHQLHTRLQHRSHVLSDVELRSGPAVPEACAREPRSGRRVHCHQINVSPVAGALGAQDALCSGALARYA